MFFPVRLCTVPAVTRVIAINSGEQPSSFEGSGLSVDAPEAFRADPPRRVIAVTPARREEIARAMDERWIATRPMTVDEVTPP